ncbi:MAG TPA: nucleotidyltransferase domain-containing protein [Thermoplasmata archaeon]|nr:nucleotidyltransferase domain-containing protein [Thermoplasmata archaeon]
MNPPRFAACLEDVRAWAARHDDVEAAIAYGSVARGTAGEDSDLDLVVLAPKDRHEALARELFLLGARHDVTISPYLVEPRELANLDPQFVESVTRDGVALKGRPLDPTVRTLELQPYTLVTLYLDHLPQKAKVALSREMYGYRSARRYKRARYESRRVGLLDRVGGRKLGRGTVLVPAKAWPDLDALVRRHRGKRSAFTVWVQRS